ncbi:MAG: Holliday junction branch migration DNA helicase RuvB [Planctomycetota bacterium]|jgi:Holliday junction DNA helicase RuvB
MARRRVIDSKAQPGDETRVPAAGSPLRPRQLDEYIGQGDLVERLAITLQAVRQRHEPMEHVLLHGPPGLGKTTMAHVIATEMGTRAYTASGPALTKASDLIGTLTRLQPHDVLFIDEIHRLPAAVEEYIYPAMEDFRVDITVDAGRHAKVVSIALKPFTLIGATTRAGLLSGALRNRFGIAHHLRFYTLEELTTILRRASDLLAIDEIPADALAAIARRSRGTPRVTLRLLRRVRDFAHVRAGGRIDETVVADALALEGVDELGLDRLDRAYLQTLAGTYKGGPAGLEAIAATLAEDSGTLADVVEPFLLQIGFVARTRQGRRLTPAAAEHLGCQVRGASRAQRAEPLLFGLDQPSQALGQVLRGPAAAGSRPQPS